MTTFEWIQLAQMIVMALAAILVYWLGRERAALMPKAEAEKEFAVLAQRIAEHEHRLERAGGKQSDLADDVQALMGRIERMPHELRTVFLDLARAEDLKSESVRDRDELRNELRMLRERLDRDGKGRR